MINKDHPLFYPRLITVIALITYFTVALLMVFLLPIFSLGFDILFGWLLGAVINLINYFLIFVQARRLQLKVENKLGLTTRSGYMFLRMGLSTLGFMISVLILDDSGKAIFNIFSVFAAYLVISVVIFITGASLKVKKSTL
jgi:uncharacterized membrane protein YGL010W